MNYKVEVNPLDYLPPEKYLESMKRLKVLIENGLPLKFEDSTTPGDKYTECSWGRCGNLLEVWPDPEDHIWPKDFVERQRVAPLRLDREGEGSEKLRCPLDTRDDLSFITNKNIGCFYFCKVFQKPRYDAQITKEETVKLYEIRIKDIENLLNNR